MRHSRSERLRRRPRLPRSWLEVARSFADTKWDEGPISDLADPDVTHSALVALSRRIDGRPAAPNTVKRRRQVFNMVCTYAATRGDLGMNPLTAAIWKPPRNVTVVDRRAVVNHRQAGALLAAVDEIAPDLTAFFAGRPDGGAEGPRRVEPGLAEAPKEQLQRTMLAWLTMHDRVGLDGEPA